MKKKVLAVLLVAAMALSACGQAKPAEAPAPAPAPAQEQKKEEPKKEEPKKEEPKKTVSGTFEGTASGMQGPITVALTIKDDVITACEVKENIETAAIAAVALDRLPKLIVEHQTMDLDTVTGATLCSFGVLNAAKKAAEVAGLDAAALKANAWSAQAGPDETWDCDVVVVGGGGAAFSSATTAAQQGANVILIEKSSFFGGNTMMAGGAYNAVDPGAQANMILTEAQKKAMDGYLALKDTDPDLKFDQFPEWKPVLAELQKDIKDFYAKNAGKTAGVDMPGYDSEALHMWHIYTGGLREMTDGSWIASNYDLAENLAHNALTALQWLESIGVDAANGSANKGLSTVLGAMWPRTHSVTSSAPLIEKLVAAAEKEGVKLYTETAAKELVKDGNGRVVAVKAEKADGTKITINAAKGVVLACGGYGANAPMVKKYDKYWGDALSDRSLTTNVGTNKGDGVVMAEAIGAATTGLQVVQMMPSSSPVKGTMTDGVWGSAESQLWIDQDGNRFVDEYAERDVLTKASLENKDSIFYIVCAGYVKGDNGMMQGFQLNGEGFGAAVKNYVDAGQIWWGSTLKELAEATKSPAAGCAPAFTEEALRATIEKYNSYVKNQEDPDFGKAVIDGAIDLEFIESHDDFGICITPRKASIHHSMGGVVINPNTEVLDTNGNVIPGLFAAGEVTGGVHAGNRLGGNAVADIFTHGHIAGMNVAK